MLVPPINKPNTSPSFGIYKGTKVRYYAPNSYFITDYGETAKGSIQIRKDYINNEFCSKLYYIKDRMGNWVKSILRYKDGDTWKTLRSKA